MQGIDTREVIKDVNKEQSKVGLKPGNVPQAAIMSPQRASFEHVGDGSRMIADALDWASKYAQDKTKEQDESERMNGTIMRQQGKAYADAKAAGGYTGEGWQVADVQITANTIFNTEREKIKGQMYSASPEDYAKYLGTQTQQYLKMANDPDTSPLVKKSIIQTTSTMMGNLANEQATAHIQYNYTKTVASIAPLLDGAISTGGADAAKQVADYMKPGAFAVHPEDATQAIKGWLEAKGNQAQTEEDLAVLKQVNTIWNQQNGKPPEEGWSQPTHIKIAPPNLDTGEEGSIQADGQEIDQTGMKVTDILSGGTASTSGGGSSAGGKGQPRSVGLDKAIAKAQERVGRNLAINTAVQTGDYSQLSPKEQTTAFDQLAKSVQSDIVSEGTIPAGTQDFSDTFYGRYAKAVAKVAAVDKGLAGTISANLVVSPQQGDNSKAQWAGKMLQTLSENGGSSQALKYVLPAQKDQAARVLSYIASGMDSNDAVLKASQVQEHVDKGGKPVVKITDADVKTALSDLQNAVETNDFSMLNPWNYIPVPFGDTSQTRWSYGMTPEELNSPSPEKSMLNATITTMAKQFLPTAQDAGAAVRKAVATLEPRVQYVAAKPLISDQPWEDKLNENAEDGAEIAKGTLEKDPTIFNAAIMESVKNQASVFQRDRDSLWGHVFKEGVSTFKTFRGKNNSLITFARGIPDYRNLSVHTSPDGDGVTVHTFKDGIESPEYVHVSNDRIRKGIIAIQMRDAQAFGTKAGITPLLDRPQERDTPNAVDNARGNITKRMTDYVMNKVKE